jgi:hypothetical protein
MRSQENQNTLFVAFQSFSHHILMSLIDISFPKRLDRYEKQNLNAESSTAHQIYQPHHVHSSPLQLRGAS